MANPLSPYTSVIGFDIETNNDLDINTAQVVQLCAKVYTYNPELDEIVVTDSLVKYYKPTHFNKLDIYLNDLEEIIANMPDLEPSEQAIKDFNDFLTKHQSKVDFIFGHNVLKYDLPILKSTSMLNVLDTKVALDKLKKLPDIASTIDLSSSRLVDFSNNNGIPINNDATHTADVDVDNNKLLLEYLFNLKHVKMGHVLRQYIFPLTIHSVKEYNHSIHKMFKVATNTLSPYEYLENLINFALEKNLAFNYLKDLLPLLEGKHPKYNQLAIMFAQFELKRQEEEKRKTNEEGANTSE